jgi:hypothetical protein
MCSTHADIINRDEHISVVLVQSGDLDFVGEKTSGSVFIKSQGADIVIFHNNQTSILKDGFLANNGNIYYIDLLKNQYNSNQIKLKLFHNTDTQQDFIGACHFKGNSEQLKTCLMTNGIGMVTLFGADIKVSKIGKISMYSSTYQSERRTGIDLVFDF